MICDDRGGLERLLEHRQHVQLVLHADALDVFEHGGAARAHELHRAAIMGGLPSATIEPTASAESSETL